jgi:deoxyribodipyrimidine photo-lyase
MTRPHRPTTSVVWFRRDLRVHDHPALAAVLARADRVVPLFVIDTGLLDGRWRSANRAWFMLESLRVLAEELGTRGARLVVAVGRPESVVPALALDVGATEVHVSREYTPYGRRRDRAVALDLAAARIVLREAPGPLVHEPEEILTAAGRPYAVFTPFHRRWSARPIRNVLAAPDDIPGLPSRMIGRSRMLERSRASEPTRLPTLRELGFDGPTADMRLLPEPGEPAARARLERWSGDVAGGVRAPAGLAPDGLAPDGLAPDGRAPDGRAPDGRASVDGYAERRDLLASEGTSRLSQDLRWGLLSPVEVAHRVGTSGDGRQRFATELAWRDFYAHVLWHEPRVARESYQARYDALAWRNDPVEVAAWRDGRTGYPVVDAAMRQLRATGWMHNRARMIVASFLTKDLLADWRIGEAHFMEHLVDGDPASNNGGWQWASSTGTDAQPYFRIFNPVSQGTKFDPDGEFVRRFIPELAAVEDRFVHAPWEAARPPKGYPDPIVSHSERRILALRRYEAARARARAR